VNTHFLGLSKQIFLADRINQTHTASVISPPSTLPFQMYFRGLGVKKTQELESTQNSMTGGSISSLDPFCILNVNHLGTIFGAIHCKQCGLISSGHKKNWQGQPLMGSTVYYCARWWELNCLFPVAQPTLRVSRSSWFLGLPPMREWPAARKVPAPMLPSADAFLNNVTAQKW